MIYKKTGKLSLIGKGYFEGAGDATVTGRGDIYFESYSSGLKAINSTNLKNMKKVSGTTRKITVSKKPIFEATLIHQQSVDPFQ